MIEDIYEIFGIWGYLFLVLLATEILLGLFLVVLNICSDCAYKKYEDTLTGVFCVILHIMQIYEAYFAICFCYSLLLFYFALLVILVFLVLAYIPYWFNKLLYHVWYSKKGLSKRWLMLSKIISTGAVIACVCYYIIPSKIMSVAVVIAYACYYITCDI